MTILTAEHGHLRVTFDLGLKVRLRCKAVATCITSSLRMPSSSSCFGSICVTTQLTTDKHGTVRFSSTSQSNGCN